MCAVRWIWSSFTFVTNERKLNRIEELLSGGIFHLKHLKVRLSVPMGVEMQMSAVVSARVGAQ